MAYRRNALAKSPVTAVERRPRARANQRRREDAFALAAAPERVTLGVTRSWPWGSAGGLPLGRPPPHPGAGAGAGSKKGGGEEEEVGSVAKTGGGEPGEPETRR